MLQLIYDILIDFKFLALTFLRFIFMKFIYFIIFLFSFDSIASIIDGNPVIKNKNNNAPPIELVDKIIDNYQNNININNQLSDVKPNLIIDNDGRYNVSKTKKDIGIKIKDPSNSEDYKVSDYISLAYKALNEDNIEEALDYYKKALQSKKNNINAMFGVGTCYQILGNNDEAKKYYLNILKIKPRYSPAINNLLLILSEDNLELAIQTLQKITQHNNTDPVLLLQLGSLINQTGNYKKALRCFKVALSTEPHNPLIMYHIANTFDVLEQKENALKFYQMTLQHLGPQDKEIDVVHIKSRIKEISKPF